jgi:hypothetical protein
MYLTYKSRPRDFGAALHASMYDLRFKTVLCSVFVVLRVFSGDLTRLIL